MTNKIGVTRVPFPQQKFSEPDIFIIESLKVNDEARGKFEGKMIHDMLKTCGKWPIYHYVRNYTELKDAIALFRHSGYRVLHLSCHGSSEYIDTTLDRITMLELANLLENSLKTKRLTVSACEVSTGFLSQLVRSKNKGMQSILLPLEKVNQDTSVAFWSIFYVHVFWNNPTKILQKNYKSSLQSLCTMFKMKIQCSWYNAEKDNWVEEAFPQAKGHFR